MANSDEALTHVKHTYLRYSLQLCEGADIIIPILQMKKKKKGHFGKLNSLPRAARSVCDGAHPELRFHAALQGVKQETWM